MNRQPEAAVRSVAPLSLAERLEAGSEALSLDIGLHERERLLSYVSLMQRWNRVYNLTAVRDPEAMLVQHVLDSLAVLNPLRASVMNIARPRLVDVGSGAGLPGLVLAVVWPELDVDLVEPVGKKAAFLRQSIADLGLAGRVRAHDCRVESLSRESDGDEVVASAAGALASRTTGSKQVRAPDLIICRAFASLADYARSIADLASPATAIFAMKARRSEIDAESAALPEHWRVLDIAPLSVPGLDAERHLVRLAAPLKH